MKTDMFSRLYIGLSAVLGRSVDLPGSWARICLTAALPSVAMTGSHHIVGAGVSRYAAGAVTDSGFEGTA